MSITERFRNKLFKMKNCSQEFYSFDSGTTNQTIEEAKKSKINKKVSFNGVDIINVESYKEFNKIEFYLQFESFENKLSGVCNECNCILV